MSEKLHYYMEQTMGYIVGFFSLVLAHLPQIDNIFQHLAIAAGALVVLTQLYINVLTIRKKHKDDR